jgi:hypothetical protein
LLRHGGRESWQQRHLGSLLHASRGDGGSQQLAFQHHSQVVVQSCGACKLLQAGLRLLHAGTPAAACSDQQARNRPVHGREAGRTMQVLPGIAPLMAHLKLLQRHVDLGLVQQSSGVTRPHVRYLLIILQ